VIAIALYEPASRATPCGAAIRAVIVIALYFSERASQATPGGAATAR
jgi:hypothetical protein